MMATQQPQQKQHTSTLPLKLKNVRSMPKWVSETHDHIGPKPPALPPNGEPANASPPALPPKGKIQPEPDYEVIEFSGQQYSNDPQSKNGNNLRPKTPDNQAQLKCTLCGSNNPWVKCEECAQQIFCASCDDMFHKHPKRKNHLRKALDINRPPIPPKMIPGQIQAPVAPPRRNKRGCPSPMQLCKDQVNSGTTVSPSQSPSVPPSTWHNRVGSLKRGLNIITRPLPETPKTPTSDGATSRSTTPRSVFDSIQRPPSVTLEKIKSKANATLDRMAFLQQRYRQQKIEKERNLGEHNHTEQHFHQWSSNLPSQFCSMSSGLNSSHFDINDDFHFNSFHHQKQQQMLQKNNATGFNGRNMSSSVFNLNHLNRGQISTQNNNWMRGNHMQQAQSMAQLNCVNCNGHQHPQSDWHQQHSSPTDWTGPHPANLNRSNLSLNMPHNYFMQPTHGYPQPVFMNSQGMPQIYPYPYPVISPGMMAMPPSVPSRIGSRLPSPTLSRKSMTLRKKRASYAEDELTDDEDSGEDDRKSFISQRSGVISCHRTRHRRVSNASQSIRLGDENEILNPRGLRSKIREQQNQRRGGSLAKLVQNDWLPQRRPSGNFIQNSPRIYSDSPISLESEEFEQPPTKALVQAKIQEKLNASAQKQAKQAMPCVQKQQLNTVPQKANPVKSAQDLEPSDGTKSEQGEEEEEGEEEEVGPDVKQKDEGSPLGPPPATPDYEWECQFCTFVNEPKTKICSICCKTPSQQPAHPSDKADQKGQTKTNKVGKKKDSSTHTTSKIKSESRVESQGKKPKEPSFEDIWATLDENIQATADEVKRKAENKATKKESTENRVSTGCGPSPPREIDTPITKKTVDTTTVEPQNISTQTYDYFPPSKSEKSKPEDEKTLKPPLLIQNQDKFIISGPKQMDSVQSPNQSYLNPAVEFVSDPNSMDTETLTSIERNLQFFRDMSLIQSERDRYRSSNNLRMGDLNLNQTDFGMSSSNFSRRQSLAEILSLQKMQTQTVSSDYFEPKPTRDMESELFLLLKEAELYKFSAEELHVALKNCTGETSPIVWLRENWPKFVRTVQNLVAKYGQERNENIIGAISQTEAREALRMHSGNIWQAVSECIEQRQRKYRDIANRGNFSREDITTALTVHQGNVDMTLLDLSKNQLKPFLMRVMGSPGGIENESGFNLQPEIGEGAVNLEIHGFGNDNGLECNQFSLSNDSSMNDDQPLHLHNAHSHFHSQNQSSSFTSISNLSAVGHESQDENVPITIEQPTANFNDVPIEQDGTECQDHMMLDGVKSTKQPNVAADGDKTKQKILIEPDSIQEMNNSLMAISLPAIPPPIADPGEFIMEEIIKPNLKNSNSEIIISPVFEEITEMTNFMMNLEKGTESHEINDFEGRSLEDAERIVLKMYTFTAELLPKEEETISNDQMLQVGESTISQNLEDKESQLWEEVDERKNASSLKNFAVHIGWNTRNTRYHRRKQNNRNFGKKIPKFVGKKIERVDAENQISTQENSKLSAKNPQENNSLNGEKERIQEHDEESNSPIVASDLVEESYEIDNQETPSSKIPKSYLLKNKLQPKLIEKIENAESKRSKRSNSFSSSEEKSIEKLPAKDASTTKESERINSIDSPEGLSGAGNILMEKEPSPSLAKMMSTPNMSQKKFSKIPVFRTQSSPTLKNLTQPLLHEVFQTKLNIDPKGSSSEIPAIALELDINVERNTPQKEKGTIAAIFSPNPNKDREEDTFDDFVENESIRSEESQETETEFHNLVDEDTEMFTNGDYLSSDDDELYSIVSDDPFSVDTMQNPTSESEMILIFGEEPTYTENRPEKDHSLTNTAVDSISNFSSNQQSRENITGLTQPTSKQNLSELVEDTQRLIKQMKEEINSTFESSEDEEEEEDEYSDDEDDLEEEIEIEEEDFDVIDYSYENERSDGDLSEDRNEISDGDLSENQDDSVKEVIPLLGVDRKNSEKHGLYSEVPSLPLHHSLPSRQNNDSNSSPNISHNEDNNEVVFTESLKLNSTQAESSQKEDDDGLKILETTPKLILQTSQVNSTEPSPTFSHIDEISPLDANQIQQKQMASENSGELEPYDEQTDAVTEVQEQEKREIQEKLDEIKSEETFQFEKQQCLGDGMIKDPAPRDAVELSSSSHSHSEYSPEMKPESIDIQEIVEKKENEVEQKLTSSKSNHDDENYPETQLVKVKEFILNEDTMKTIENNKDKTPQIDIASASTSNFEKTITNKLSVSKIPKPKITASSSVSAKFISTKKVTTRSNSFSGVPSPIGLSSVKAIKQEFINKQSALNITQPMPKNPPQILRRKKSITDTISKLTKPSKSSSSLNSITNFKQHSTRKRLPKKNYHETCFSDEEYQTTTSEDEAFPVSENRNRKQSAPVFRTYNSIQEVDVEKPEILAKKFMDQNLVTSYAEAHIAGALVSMKFPQDASIWAAKECSDLDQAISLLRQECELCMGAFPMNQIISMLKCTHKCCKECAKNYFTVQITERSINDCNCPFCKTPELHESTANEDENLEYFSNLDILLKNILTSDVHELFQRKLRDRTLLQDPNFKWCVQCSSGFFARPKQKRLICPDCGSVTCSQCRKTWEKQHEGLSCEKYLEWKQLNDPEVQANGVAEHLAKNGIDCPKCHFRYSLARGGCMHFTCTQCKYEFCYGCGRPFTMGAKCSISPYCSKLGLHAHHPRNCLFYLRDKDPFQLQQLLKRNHVIFDETPPDSDRQRRSPIRCPIPLQKETPRGLVDVICKNEVPDRHAGLCRTHYVEYLAGKVAKANVDPLPIFDLTDCIQELRRRGIPLPERGPWDTDEIYREMCSKVIKEKIPL